MSKKYTEKQLKDQLSRQRKEMRENPWQFIEAIEKHIEERLSRQKKEIDLKWQRLLKAELSRQKKEIVEWCEKRNEKAQDLLMPEARPRRTVLNELIDYLKNEQR